MLETWVIKKPSCRNCGLVVAAVAIPAAGIVLLADLQSTGYELPWQQLPALPIINTAHRMHQAGSVHLEGAAPDTTNSLETCLFLNAVESPATACPAPSLLEPTPREAAALLL